MKGAGVGGGVGAAGAWPEAATALLIALVSWVADAPADGARVAMALTGVTGAGVGAAVGAWCCDPTQSSQHRCWIHEDTVSSPPFAAYLLCTEAMSEALQWKCTFLQPASCATVAKVHKEMQAWSPFMPCIMLIAAEGSD